MADPASELHASGLRADLRGGIILRRLVLPVPWLRLRYVWAHPSRPCAAQPRCRAVCVHEPHFHPHRLSRQERPNVSGPSTYEPKTGFTRWLDKRLPIVRLGYDSFVAYPTPRNLNYWWTFGAM